MIVKRILVFFLFFGLSGSAQQTVGVFINEEETFDGLLLFAPPGKEIYLINNCGEMINSWSSEFNNNHNAELMENGNLVVNCRFPNIPFGGGGSTGRLEMFNWEGDLLWGINYLGDLEMSHHDFTVLPNGNILLLSWDRKLASEAEAAGREHVNANGIWSEKVVEIQPIGTDQYLEVWSWYLWDHLIQEYDDTKDNYGDVSESPERMDLNFASNPNSNADWFHLNSIDYNEDLDQILLSSRHTNEIYIIDHSTTTEEAATSVGGNANKGGDFLFRWGNPIAYQGGDVDNQKLFGQHNARWIEAENLITVFNNGQGRPTGDYSSIEEIHPNPMDVFNYEFTNGQFTPEEASWQYTGNPVSSFYSSRISSAQRLPNNNTIICEGREGTFFEVNSLGEKVWEYINPVNIEGPVVQESNPGSNDVFKIKKYAYSFEGFDGKDLSPSAPIELDPLPYECLSSTQNEKENIHFQIVNPFAESIFIETDLEMPLAYSLTDINGKVLHQSFLHSDKRINTQHLPAGIYILTIRSEFVQRSFKLVCIK